MVQKKVGMTRRREGKEKVPNPVLSLEEIEKGKALSVEPSSKRRRFLTAEKKFEPSPRTALVFQIVSSSLAEVF